MKIQSASTTAAAAAAAVTAAWCWSLPLSTSWIVLPTTSTTTCRQISSAMRFTFHESSSVWPHTSSPQSTRPSLTKLFSVAPVLEDPSTTEGTTTTPSAPLSSPSIIAEGAIVAQFPGGLTAIRINEDVTLLNGATQNPSVIGVVTPALAQSGSKATSNSATSGDYLGKRVVFPNGASGVVVIHRPPLVFCYSNDAYNPVVSDGMVQVGDDMVTLTASLKNRNVDCFGAPYTNNNDSNGELSVSSLASSTLSLDEDDLSPRAIFSSIPKVANIALINNPLLSGNTMMDVLAPVGRGQNMLLIGSDYTPLRGLAYDFVRQQGMSRNTDSTDQNGSSIRFVYASTDPNREAALERLREAGIADGVHFVGSASRSSSTSTSASIGMGDSTKAVTATATVATGDSVSRAAEAVLIASTACSIAESYALEKGEHTMVIVDNIDAHKVLWDATTRVLVDVFGVDAVVKSDLDGGASSEMRGFYSSLIQRAGQYNAKLGGGSVTLLLLTSIPKAVEDDDNDSAVFLASDFAQSSERIQDRFRVLEEKGIPLSAATLRKINIPIPTLSEGKRRLELQHIDDLISMSDGQVWLDDALASMGQQPPIDPQRSITRVGIGADTQSRADAPAFRRIAEGIRLELSQAASMVGTEATVASRKQFHRQQAILLAMHQPTGSGSRRLSESCVALLAVKLGYLDAIVEKGAVSSTPEGTAVMQSLLGHVLRVAPHVMNEIDETLDIGEEARSELTEVVASFFASYRA